MRGEKRLITYQDLLAVGDEDGAKIDFIRKAIKEHKASDAYKRATSAQLYYEGENPTINQYEKVVYDLSGKAHTDMYSANHKIASKFFGLVVDQENSYLLGNGVTFSNEQTKKRLGYDFDQKIQMAGQYALIDGVSFGFWNKDHVETFRLADVGGEPGFVPLYNEETAALSAGIRYWQLAANKPLRATLYELDGLTEYIENADGDMAVMKPKGPYQSIIRKSVADGNEILGGANYESFPIVPLMNNKQMTSEITGRQNTIDALDLLTSGMVNGVDEGSLIYWVLKNAGGMDDLDDVKFRDRLKTIGVIHTEDGVEASPHQIQVPFAGTQAAIDMLKRQLYEDFQCFDSSAVTAGNQTATAINASYVPLDLKCDKFERQVTAFILGILKLAGIDDSPTYTRNRITNKNEELQTILLAAQYLDDEYLTKKVLTILGDADEFEDMQNRKISDDARLTTVPDENEV